ncbi:hypothetical protein TNCV_286011 [Trichonephila clavipes]|nr:hypothetical protein TNCV_286011 [Trichonephila clavipes]
MVKVTVSWQGVMRSLEPCTSEDPPCRGGQCTLNISWLKRPPVGVVRNRPCFRRVVRSSIGSSKESLCRELMHFKTYEAQTPQIGMQSVVMSELSDVKRGMVIGARLSGTSDSRTANFVGVSRTTVSKARCLLRSTTMGNVEVERPWLDLEGNEIVDTLAKAGARELPEPSAPLTFLEIFSRTKHQKKTAWITPSRAPLASMFSS